MSDWYSEMSTRTNKMSTKKNKPCDVEQNYNSRVQALADIRQISFEEAEKLYLDVCKAISLAQGL